MPLQKAKRQNQSGRFYFHEADRIWISISRQHFFVSRTNNLDYWRVSRRWKAFRCACDEKLTAFVELDSAIARGELV